jgi:hypothetical protein
MNSVTQKRLRAYFAPKSAAIFWPGELSRILEDLRLKCDALDLNAEQILKFLLNEGILVKAEFRSPKYPPIVRYFCGRPSPYQLATSLRRHSFLCHETALVLHGFASPSQLIYVNQEQTPKPASDGVTQEAITSAFSNRQRKSQYIFRYAGTQYVLLSGKNTARTGVVQMKRPNGEDVEVTDVERTLIDAVVRPTYAGGIKQVANAYNHAVHKLDIGHMIKLLKKMQYVYPYHQSVGFLLERAGRSEQDCRIFKRLGTEFDFYLDYKMKNPLYNENWRLFYPSLLPE